MWICTYGGVNRSGKGVLNNPFSSYLIVLFLLFI